MGSDSFDDLLRKLSQVHQLQVEELQQTLEDNQSLREQLDRSKLAAAGSARSHLRGGLTQISCLNGGEKIEPRFEIMKEWAAPLKSHCHSTTTLNVINLSLRESRRGAVMPEKLELPQLRHFIHEPGSPKRIAWDLFGAILIWYDLHFIPLGAFDIPPHTFTDFMDWLSMLFWTVNVAASLLVGYVKNGETVMEPRKIFLHYMKTWFVVDMAVVVPDWVFLIASLSADGPAASAGDDASGSVKLMRIVRLVRMIRLVRLLKLRQALDHINDMIDSEFLSITVSIVQMILLLLTINHLVACSWFYIGSGTAYESTWVRTGFEHYHWTYQYLTASHWAITQFTPSSMSVQPENALERFFAINVVVFALVVFSYIVGSITGSLTQLRNMHQERNKEFWNFRRFMKMNRVPQALSTRLGKYLDHAWQNQRDNLSEKDINIFKFLSEQLHSELQWEISMPTLKVHPLFVLLLSTCSVTMHRLAHKALKHSRLVEDDPLFLTGEKGTHLYFIVKGSMHYRRVDAFSERREQVVSEQEDWIAEPVLWTKYWNHLGRLKATTADVNLLMVSPGSFSEVISGSPSVHHVTRRYAKHFCRWLCSSAIEDLTDIFSGDDDRIRVERFLAESE